MLSASTCTDTNGNKQNNSYIKGVIVQILRLPFLRFSEPNAAGTRPLEREVSSIARSSNHGVAHADLNIVVYRRDAFPHLVRNSNVHKVDACCNVRKKIQISRHYDPLIRYIPHAKVDR